MQSLFTKVANAAIFMCMDWLLALIAYVIIGSLAGIMGGLLGIGGGVITVPSLYLVFRLLGYPQPYLMHIAIGTSLAAMIFNTAASTWAHNKRQGVLWDVFKRMVPGLIIGSIIGAFLAEWLSGVILEIVFGVFLCVLALQFWRKLPEREEHHRLPHAPLLMLWSAAIGIISNILGLGGGTLIVPFLTAFKIPAKKAIGTSAACSLVVSCIGAFSFLVIGLKSIVLPEDVGFIDLPAFFVVGIVSFLTAPYGAKLTHQLSIQRIRKIFAFVLIVTGIFMII